MAFVTDPITVFLENIGNFLAGHTTTGEELRLLPFFWQTSTQIIGPPRCGKSDLLLRMLWHLADTNAGVVLYDLSGTLYRQYLLAVADQADDLGTVGRTSASRDARARAHIARHAFVDVGRRDQVVGIDILRPVTFPDGTSEEFQDVADRVIDGFTFEDMDVRQRFQKIGKHVLILLSAGARPITEYRLVLFGDPAYIAFLVAEISRRNAEHDRNVVEAFSILSALWYSTKTTFERNRDSTESAILPFDDKYVGPFFSRGTVRLEDVVFSGLRLAVCAASSPRSSFILKMLHAQIVNLALHRDSTCAPLYLVMDDPSWVEHNDLAGSIETFRNFNTFYIIARQVYAAHFKDRRTADLIDGSVGTSIDFRQRDAEAMRRLLPTLRTFSPDGMWIIKPVHSHSEADSIQHTTSNQHSRRRGRTPGSPLRRTRYYDAEGFEDGSSIADQLSPVDTIDDTDGTADTDGTTHISTDTITDQPFRIPVSEQKEVALDELQRLPNHTCVVSTGPTSTIIETVQAPQTPSRAGKRDLRSWLLDEQSSMLGAPVGRTEPPPPPLFQLPTPPKPKVNKVTVEHVGRDTTTGTKSNGKPTGRHGRSR